MTRWARTHTHTHTHTHQLTLTSNNNVCVFQAKDYKAQNEQLLTVNTTLGSEVTKLQKELGVIRSQQGDGAQVVSLQEELEKLREELREAHAHRKRQEEEHSSEKMELTQVRLYLTSVRFSGLFRKHLELRSDLLVDLASASTDVSTASTCRQTCCQTAEKAERIQRSCVFTAALLCVTSEGGGAAEGELAAEEREGGDEPTDPAALQEHRG